MPKVLPFASGRVAAWALDEIVDFEAPVLRSAGAAICQLRHAVDAARGAVVDSLGEVIPGTSDRTTRRALLDARRTAFRGRQPLPAGTDLPATAEEDRRRRNRLADLTADFDEAYQHELDRQRSRLHALGADERFRTALQAASPGAGRDWARLLEHGDDGRARTTKIEDTATRFLLRAAGRATPFGGWAHDGVVGPGADDWSIDRSAPGCRFTWSTGLRQEIGLAIEEQHRFWGGWAEQFRAATIDMIADGALYPPQPAEPDTTRGVFGLRPIPAAAVDRAIAQWTDEIGPHAAAPSMTVAIEPTFRGGPAGTVVCTPSDAGVWIGGSRPHPGVLATRTPVARAVRDLYRSWPLEVVGLVGADPLRPQTSEPVAPLTDRVLDAAGLSSVAVDPPFLVEDGVRAVLAYDSTAAIGTRDPLSRLLALTASSLGWELPGFGFPALPRERSTWKHLPRLTLPGGAILSPERWTVDGDRLDDLLTATGAAQYLLWQSLVGENRWPDAVHVRWDPHPHGPMLPVRTSSPLAVRAALNGVPPGTARLVISEVPPSGVPDGSGRRYVAEIGAIWHDPSYWRERP